MAELVGYISVDYANELDELHRFRQQFKADNSGETVGEVVQWQRADGYAQYMVVSEQPLQLVHIEMGDAYSVEASLIRGLILKDVQKMVDRERSIRQIFANNSPG